MIKKLFILLLFVLLIPIFGCGSTKSNPTPTLYIKLGFVNASGLVASRIHVVIDGYNSAGQWGYYDLSQDPAVFSVTSDMSSVPDTTLDALIAHGAITIPYIVSGRVYLGLDQRVSAEAADFTTPNSPSGIIYDKFELSVAPTGNVINLTQVDYFNFPLKITCTSEVRGFNDGITRKNVFDEYLAAMSNGWEKLALTDNLGNRLRILNPAKIAPADAAYFSQLYSYWDALINVYWATGKTLTILTDDLPNRIITGVSNGNTLDFGADGTYGKPSTLQMFGQAVVTSESSANVVKWVSCAINRGVFKNPNVTDEGNSDKFYEGSVAINLGVYNKYAEFFHRTRYTINGQAYALAFDDEFGYDSALTIPNGGTVTVKLQPFQ